MRIGLYGCILTLVILPILAAGFFVTPVFADHEKEEEPVRHSSKKFAGFEIEYRTHGVEIKKIQSDRDSKKLILDLKITATPVFFEIDVPRELLDARHGDLDVDYEIFLGKNRPRYDEVHTSSSHRTLEIPLRGVFAGEIVDLEIIGTHFLEKYPKQESEEFEKEVKMNEEQVEKEEVELEAKEKAELEAKLKAELEAELKAELEAELKAEKEAKEKAEKEKADLEAKLREEEAKLRAEQEVKIKAEQEAKEKAILEAQLKAEQEAKLKEEQEVKLKAEKEAKLKAEEKAWQKENEKQGPSPILVFNPMQLFSNPSFIQELDAEAARDQKPESSENAISNMGASSAVSDSILVEVKPEPQMVFLANTESENTTKKDDCFICKNKVLEERKNRQNTEPVEQVEQAENQTTDVEESDDESSFLDDFLKQIFGIFS